MNKRILALVGLFSLSTMPVSVFAEENNRVNRDMSQVSSQLKRFLSSNVGALVMGSCAGAATGSAVRYLQNQVVQRLGVESALIKLLLTIAACNVGAEVRDNIVAGLQSSLDDYEIECQDKAMARSAMIASVLTYFNV